MTYDSDLFEPVGGKSTRICCKACGRSGCEAGSWQDACKRGHTPCPDCGRQLSLLANGSPRTHQRCPAKNNPPGYERPQYVGPAIDRLYRVKRGPNRWEVFIGQIGKASRFIGVVTLTPGATWPIARRPYTDEFISELGTLDDAARAVRDDALIRERASSSTVAQLQ